MNYLVVIAYDGSSFQGWQRQPGARTVQGDLESALQGLFRAKIDVHGSGRTDSGAHAYAQTAHFKMDLDIGPARLASALNSALPGDILVTNCAAVDPEFHARYSAVGKTYVYKFYTAQERNPFHSRNRYYAGRHLDLKAMERAAYCFIGTHDFGSFCATGSDKKNKTRQITQADIKSAGGHESGSEGGHESGSTTEYEFTITGSGFLYKMVRTIVGEIIAAGRGRSSQEKIIDLLARPDKDRNKDIAPACGLYLWDVYY